MSFRATKKSDYDSYLEIDLKELFGKDVPDNSKFRQAVGQEIIDTIIKRTRSAKYLTNAKQTYSDEYSESLDFKVHNKSKTNYNLTQSGDMLGLMDIIEDKKQKIVIGWDDSTEKAKATNLNFGVTLPKHEFLGLTQKEAALIKDKFKQSLNNAVKDDKRSPSMDKLSAFVRGELDIDQQNAKENIINSMLTDFLLDEDL